MNGVLASAFRGQQQSQLNWACSLRNSGEYDHVYDGLRKPKVKAAPGREELGTVKRPLAPAPVLEGGQGNESLGQLTQSTLGEAVPPSASFFGTLAQQMARPESQLRVPVDDHEEPWQAKVRIAKKRPSVPALYEKIRSSFDQEFLNEEDDQPLESRRFLPYVPNPGAPSGAVLLARQPSCPREVVIKPADFTIRASTVQRKKHKMSNKMPSLNSQKDEGAAEKGFSSRVREMPQEESHEKF